MAQNKNGKVSNGNGGYCLVSHDKMTITASDPTKWKQTLMKLLSELTDLRDAEELEHAVNYSTPAAGGSNCPFYIA